MAGLKLEEMGVARDEFRPSLTRPGFPTIESRAGWDARNARVLRVAGADSANRHARRALELADRIDPEDPEDCMSPIPNSMASARYRSHVADLFGAHASELCAALEEPAHFVSVIPSYGEVDDPDEISAELFKERLRFDLNSLGALRSDGFLMAVIEAEYQMRTGGWRFHWHGVASGAKLQAVDGLRSLPAYHSPRRQQGEPKPEVAYRTNIARRPLFNLPDPLTYCIKPWNARWVDEDGDRSRRRRLSREALPAALLWQDRWSPGNITLLMGLRPGRQGFVVINSTRTK